MRSGVGVSHDTHKEGSDSKNVWCSLKSSEHLSSQRFNSSSTMAIDWLGFGYAAAIGFGGFMGYKRKGSVMSLIAGLVFGALSAYGALKISMDVRDTSISLLSSGVLALVMGMRFKNSGKLLPAGLMAVLSLLMFVRTLFRIMM